MVKTQKDEHLYKVFAEAFHEVVEPLLVDMNEHFGGVDARLNSIDTTLGSIDTRLSKVESDTYFIKQDIKDIKVELADTPTRKEFNKLQLKVDAISP